ncbi:MAG: TetR/AcrR family transcriptional regulator [Alphaproteobacteria bacterium]|nr:TetR/AcrR family transcriptional regulator [Alphaproteobacteria bacterium]
MSITLKAAPRSRRRRNPSEVRQSALAEARRLLIEQGPDAVTLKSVARALSMTHSNLLHHFGSAAELQSALMSAMVRDLNDALIDAVAHVEDHAGAPRELVDRVFDAFDKGGAGRLAAWMSLTNNADHVEPVRDAILDLVAGIERTGPANTAQTSALVLFVSLLAFGDAVIGAQLAAILGLERNAARALTSALLARLVAAGPNSPGPLDPV